jgi:hypothetical protein
LNKKEDAGIVDQEQFYYVYVMTKKY